MAANEFLNEVLPKQGHLYTEETPMPVLCKPKILPLKSVTLEKLEQMQKEAQDVVKRQEQEEKMQERLLEQQREIMRQTVPEDEWIEKKTRNTDGQMDSYLCLKFYALHKKSISFNGWNENNDGLTRLLEGLRASSRIVTICVMYIAIYGRNLNNHSQSWI